MPPRTQLVAYAYLAVQYIAGPAPGPMRARIYMQYTTRAEVIADSSMSRARPALRASAGVDETAAVPRLCAGSYMYSASIKNSNICRK
jgi:hypothetical protein